MYLLTRATPMLKLSKRQNVLLSNLLTKRAQIPIKRFVGVTKWLFFRLETRLFSGSKRALTISPSFTVPF